MKKTILVVFVLLLLGGGYFYLQQTKAKNNLLQATGKTYKSLGIIELEIPKTEQKITGWKNPSIPVPEVILKLSVRGEKKTVRFKGALLKADSLNPQRVQLILEKTQQSCVPFFPRFFLEILTTLLVGNLQVARELW